MLCTAYCVVVCYRCGPLPPHSSCWGLREVFVCDMVRTRAPGAPSSVETIFLHKRVRSKAVGCSSRRPRTACCCRGSGAYETSRDKRSVVVGNGMKKKVLRPTLKILGPLRPLCHRKVGPYPLANPGRGFSRPARPAPGRLRAPETIICSGRYRRADSLVLCPCF